MKKSDRFYSLQFKMFLIFTGMLLLVGTLISGIFVSRFYSVYQMQATSHMKDVESLATESVSNIIGQIDQLSVSVIVDQVVQTNLAQINNNSTDSELFDYRQLQRDMDAIRSQIRGNILNTDGVYFLRIYSLAGEELLIGGVDWPPMEYSLTPEQVYEANGSALWSLDGAENYLCMYRAILNTETLRPLGHMVILCRNDLFSRRLATLPNTYSGKVYLVDDERQVLSSSNTDFVAEQFPFTPGELRQRENVLIEDPFTGERSFFFVGKALKNGWSLVITVTAEAVMEQLTTNLIQIAIFLLLTVLIFLALTLVVIRKLAEPTQKLLQSIRTFAEGDMSIRVEVRSRDEVGIIGQEYNRMADKIQNLLERVYILELANKEAEIEFLKMQINPHFLYNTLDVISWLGFSNGCEAVSDLAVSLAKLLRSSIKNDDMITVQREMETVRDYLHIQSYRFKDRFMVKYEIDDHVDDCYMPNFILQPLIENGILHGLEDQLRLGQLIIQIKKGGETDWLYFTVADDGKGMDSEQLQALVAQCKDVRTGKSAIGLKNVYRRLYLLYGDDCQFSIESKRNEGTKISFRIPIITERRDVL